MDLNNSLMVLNESIHWGIEELQCLLSEMGGCRVARFLPSKTKDRFEEKAGEAEFDLKDTGMETDSPILSRLSAEGAYVSPALATDKGP